MWESGWWMFLGPIWMVVVIGAVVTVVVLLVRWLSPSDHGGARNQPAAKTPMDILRERFARGEIDAEEFEQRRKLLE
jgi:putative membrane protein